MRNGSGIITTNTTEIIRIKKEYYKKICNLDEMDKFLKRYKLLKLMQEETEYFNIHITSIKIELVIKNFQIKKISGPNGFIDEFSQTFTNS